MVGCVDVWPLHMDSLPSDRGKAWADEGCSLGPDRHARDVDSLDRYAMERWEVILHFMVGSPSAAVSQDLAQLLIQAGLMRRYEASFLCSVLHSHSHFLTSTLQIR